MRQAVREDAAEADGAEDLKTRKRTKGKTKGDGLAIPSPAELQAEDDDIRNAAGVEDDAGALLPTARGRAKGRGRGRGRKRSHSDTQHKK